METVKDLNWFKNEMISILNKYDVSYKFYEEGDFGSLNQIVFESPYKGGVIDFWSKGWLGVHLVDYVKGEELLNALLEPYQEEEKANFFKQLKELL